MPRVSSFTPSSSPTERGDSPSVRNSSLRQPLDKFVTPARARSNPAMLARKFG